MLLAIPSGDSLFQVAAHSEEYSISQYSNMNSDGPECADCDMCIYMLMHCQRYYVLDYLLKVIYLQLGLSMALVLAA